MRLLVVDDNAAYLTACTGVLTADGHDVVGCGSFDEGRRLLSRGAFDAIVADVRLGAYNGLHLLTLAPPAAVKIAMSAFADPVLRHDAEQAGARFVVKPADCTSLSALLLPHPA